MQDTCSFWWVFGKTHLCLYNIVPLIYTTIALSEACKQVKSGPNFIGLWLAKIFILGPYCIQAKIFCGQAPGNILIHSKISTPCYDFLELFRLRLHGKFIIKNILTFRLLLEKSMVKLSCTVQSILGPSIYGINIGSTNCCALLVDVWRLGGLCTSIS